MKQLSLPYFRSSLARASLSLCILLPACHSGSGSSTVRSGSINNGAPMSPESTSRSSASSTPEAKKRFLTSPLFFDFYTADPSAHVFGERLYIYPSHDIESGIAEDDLGSHFDMRDYHVLSLDNAGGPLTDHGVALDISDVPWAKRQMWAPDAAERNGKYFLYFPAKDADDIFRIGVAASDSPAGPFTPEPEAIAGSFSIDPAVFRDDDGSYYMYFGGIWGGQLQRHKSGKYRASDDAQPPEDAPALHPKVALLSEDMRSFAQPVRDVIINDEQARPLRSGDHQRRFFEAAFVHKYQGTYYLSYSTGDTHLIVYATGKSPYGPFTYRGEILSPVLGWTSHHSITQYRDKWYLFYHDCELSGGKTHLRNIKMTELHHESDGSIRPIRP